MLHDLDFLYVNLVQILRAPDDEALQQVRESERLRWVKMENSLRVQIGAKPSGKAIKVSAERAESMHEVEEAPKSRGSTISSLSNQSKDSILNDDIAEEADEKYSEDAAFVEEPIEQDEIEDYYI